MTSPSNGIHCFEDWIPFGFFWPLAGTVLPQASTLGREADCNQGLTLGTVDIIYTDRLLAGRT